MVSGGMSCVKYLLFAFNLLFAVSTKTKHMGFFSGICIEITEEVRVFSLFNSQQYFTLDLQLQQKIFELK